MKILFIFGTRPEAIKLAPVIREFRREDYFHTRICITAQHREMIDQVLEFFDIKADYDLSIMKSNQSLFDVTADIMKGLESVLSKEEPDVVLVQGDTTTAFAGALAAFYMKIPVAHIEAGLRSYEKYSPFPEEINRVLVGHIADYHFAPTRRAKENLLKEGINENKIYVVGNTVIDALFNAVDLIKEREKEMMDYFNYIDFNKRLILVTCHRRESFGDPFRNICAALKEIAKSDVEIVYPVHLNPNVRKQAYETLEENKNIHLIDPLSYPYLVWLMNKSYLILTDSGGIQEEAPSLGKPVLVMRDVTERVEGIDAGTAKLIGREKESIVENTMILLNDMVRYNAMSKAVNPYGDGKTSERIVEVIHHYAKVKDGES